VRRLVAIAALLVMAGCKGCVEEDLPPTMRASKLSPIESRRLSVLDRRAARNIDPNKKLTTDAAGVTQCGRDIDCFVLTAEKCSPSVLDHTQDLTLFGIVQHLAARYTIVGESEGSCELHRRIDELEVTLHPELIAALRSTGRTDAELATMKAEAQQKSVDRNPRRQACRFEGDEPLEAVLDLAEGTPSSRVWNKRCTAVKEQPTEAPAPGSTAPPEAKVGADAPAAGGAEAIAPAR
jgi:hypothetical protein